MKSLFIFIFVFSTFPCVVFSKTTGKLEKVPPSVEGEHPLQKPFLRPGQYTAQFKGRYHIFEVKEFNKLKLSKNCFNKKSQPKCQAYDIAKIKVKDVVATVPGQTNPASMHCSRMSGENLIAYDHENKEFDYCRFSDNSLVSSWSMLNSAYVGYKK